jgi:hypothetical protein
MPWYDEPVELLEKVVRSLANVADRLFALDGAYARVPDARPSSPPEQAQVIARTAAEIGMECLILTPHRVWVGQVEKRTHLLQNACDSDWICWVDADHIVHGDRDQIRQELADTAEDVVDVPYHYPPPPGDLEEASGTEWHYGLSGTSVWTPHFFRPLSGIRYERFHYWISALKDGQRVWMWADAGQQSYPQLPHKQVRCDYHVEHECLLREKKQILRNRAFCNDRVHVVEATGQEDDLAEAPKPRYDYDFNPVPTFPS